MRFPLDIIIKDLSVKDTANNSILYLSDFNTEFKFLPLFKGEIKSDSIFLKNLTLDSKQIIPQIKIEGNLNEFLIYNPSIKLNHFVFDIPQIKFKGSKIEMELISKDKEPKDTTPSNPVDMSFLIGDINISDISYTLSMPEDSLYLSTNVDSLNLNNAHIDIANDKYFLDHLSLTNSDYEMRMGSGKTISGFDPNDFKLHSINIAIDSFLMDNKDIFADIKKISAKEGKNFSLRDFSSLFEFKKDLIVVRNLNLRTTSSSIKADIDLNLGLLKNETTGNSYASLNAIIGNRDIIYFTESYMPDIDRLIADKNISCDIDIKGKGANLDIKKMNLLFGDILDANINGDIFLASKLENIRANILLNSIIKPDNSLNEFIPGDILLPSEIEIVSNTNLNNNIINNHLELIFNGSNIELDALYNISLSSYEAQIKGSQIDIDKIMPVVGISHLHLDRQSLVY